MLITTTIDADAGSVSVLEQVVDVIEQSEVSSFFEAALSS
jgi:hypothetical protein